MYKLPSYTSFVREPSHVTLKRTIAEYEFYVNGGTLDGDFLSDDVLENSVCHSGVDVFVDDEPLNMNEWNSVKEVQRTMLTTDWLAMLEGNRETVKKEVSI